MIPLTKIKIFKIALLGKACSDIIRSKIFLRLIPESLIMERCRCKLLKFNCKKLCQGCLCPRRFLHLIMTSHFAFIRQLNYRAFKYQTLARVLPDPLKYVLYSILNFKDIIISKLNS